MRRFIAILIINAAWAGWASVAPAALIDVTYALPASASNNTILLAGQIPTGGTVILRLNLTGAGNTGNLISVNQFVIANWTHPTAGSVTYAGFGAVTGTFTSSAPPSYFRTWLPAASAPTGIVLALQARFSKFAASGPASAVPHPVPWTYV